MWCLNSFKGCTRRDLAALMRLCVYEHGIVPTRTECWQLHITDCGDLQVQVVAEKVSTPEPGVRRLGYTVGAVIDPVTYNAAHFDLAAHMLDRFRRELRSVLA